jgi:hypothetical protein
MLAARFDSRNVLRLGTKLSNTIGRNCLRTRITAWKSGIHFMELGDRDCPHVIRECEDASVLPGQALRQEAATPPCTANDTLSEGASQKARYRRCLATGSKAILPCRTLSPSVRLPLASIELSRICDIDVGHCCLRLTCIRPSTTEIPNTEEHSNPAVQRVAHVRNTIPGTFLARMRRILYGRGE